MRLWESDPIAHISIRPSLCLLRSSAEEPAVAAKVDVREKAEKERRKYGTETEGDR